MGRSTLLIAKRIGVEGKIIAFEPSEYYRNMLKKNIKINQYSNVYTYESALFDQDCKNQFRLPTGTVVISDEVQDTTISIKCEKLDTVVGELCLPRIDFVKIDIEGGEMNCLLGMEEVISRFKPKLINEVHSNLLQQFNYTANDIMRFLESHSYKIRPFGVSKE